MMMLWPSILTSNQVATKDLIMRGAQEEAATNITGLLGTTTCRDTVVEILYCC